MSAFDFNLAEQEFAEPSLTLRERARAEWMAESAEMRTEAVVVAQEALSDILGVADGTDVKVDPRDNGADISMTVDNLRFRVEVRFKNGEAVRDLRLQTTNGVWVIIRQLADVGRALSKDPCYVVAPERDGRGAE